MSRELGDLPSPEDYFEEDAIFQWPEKRLALAVIEDAVGALRRYAFGTDRRERRLYQETSEWFASSDRSWPFSFENLCDFLEMDPGYIRRGLREWRQSVLHGMHNQGDAVAAR